ncbi:hypothetical protein [Corynebacterium stationis]|uniref:hypothetical protein n=1 Tax=Corynebacterium stationis TaxID=1705 RepID=UPI0028A997C8|nr:hypothetical protein [Corynebacterium stationis]
MSDIIQHAKRLLEGITPAPWKVYAWERHPDSDVYVMNEDGEMVTDEGWIHPADGHLIAAAPELATALAQETYEYRYERKLIYQTNEWQPMAEAKWYPTPELAESAASRAPNSLPVRLTRRRVSQPEVME